MHDASVAAVKLHLGAARTLGMDPNAHLRAAGIAAEELSAADARIELSRTVGLIRGIANAAPVPSYGLWLGEHFHPSKVSPVGYLMMNAATLRESVELYCRYQQVVGGAFVWALHPARSGQTWLEMVEMRLPPIAALAQEWGPAAALTSLRVLGAEPIVPLAAEFAHSRPRWHEEYSRVFRCPTTFDAGRTRLRLLDADLDKPVTHRDPSLVAHFEALCKRALDGLSDEVPMSRRVTELLLRIMPGEEPGIARVARRLAVSPRTLQAQLQKEATSYKDLLARARKDLAEHHLRDPTISIAEVSFLLGFSEPSAFHRAFKRWTGATPAAFRAAARAACG